MITVKLPLLNAQFGSVDDRLKTLVEEHYANNPIETTIVEETCPAFDEVGSTVLCDPVEDFPMSVVSRFKQKNLFNPAAVSSKIMRYDETTGLWTIDTQTFCGTTSMWVGLLSGVSGLGSPVSTDKLTNLIRVPPKTNITTSIKDLNVVTADNGEQVTSGYLFNISFYDETGTRINGRDYMIEYGDALTRTSPDVDPCYMDIKRHSANNIISFSSIQVELGDKATAYEPYTGFTNIELNHAGKNLLDTSKFYEKHISFDESTGLWTTKPKTAWFCSLFQNAAGNAGWRDVNALIEIPSNIPITITVNDCVVTSLDGLTLEENKSYLSAAFHYSDGTRYSATDLKKNGSIMLTSPDIGRCYLDIRVQYASKQQVSFSSIQVEIGDKPTDYEPYRGEIITLDFGQTVYGGTLDWNTGVLTVTYEGAGAEPEEPYTIQLTPQEILGLAGTNCLYSSTGDTHVTGYTPPKAVIKKLENAIAALGGNV